MKRNIPIQSISKWIILIFIITFYVSCKKDGTKSENSKTDKYSELQRWYDSEKAKSSDSILPGLKPDWSKVKIRQDSTKIIYEIEVENPNKVFLANQKVDVSNATDAYKLSQFRLVIIFDQKTNTKQGAYMNILGDSKSELNKEVRYKKTGTFSGKIQYYGITGKYLNGWVYKNGKIEKIISAGQLSKEGVRTEENICSTSATPRYGMICAGAENGGCTVTLLGWSYSTTCESFDPEGGTGGGGVDFGSGGGSPGTTPAPYPEIIVSLKDYPCAQALALQLPNLTNDVAQILKETFSQNDLVNVTFEPRPYIAGTKTDGELVSSSGSNYVIGINPDILSNATKEYILVTLYHEGLHAYFSEKLRVLGQAEFDKQFLGIQVNGGRLVAVQNEGHWPMGYDKYIRGLKNAILSYNPSFGDDRALALAECGIIQLDSSSSSINDQERDTRKPGFKGTKCL